VLVVSAVVLLWPFHGCVADGDLPIDRDAVRPVLGSGTDGVARCR
jgi:hypothetical protein